MIIFINGPINAGKTTVGKLLKEKIGNTALVEIDSLREMIDWMPIEASIPLNLENAVSVIKNFVNRGLNVIVPYPLSKENYEYMRNSLEDLNTKMHFFTLAPELESALRNRGNRELGEDEKERVKHLYKIGIASPSFGEVIDNTHQTPEETTDYILNRIA